MIERYYRNRALQLTVKLKMFPKTVHRPTDPPAVQQLTSITQVMFVALLHTQHARLFQFISCHKTAERVHNKLTLLCVTGYSVRCSPAYWFPLHQSVSQFVLQLCTTHVALCELVPTS